MPEAEMWTYSPLPLASHPIKKIGINFGAPGDRLTDTGTLWLDYPSVGGYSPNASVSISPVPQYFRHHAGRFASQSNGWVTASGAIGLTNATIQLNHTDERDYLVRLYFAEPENAQEGDRVFDVALQGKRVLTDFDIAKDAGPEGDGIVREFTARATNNLTLTLTPSIGQPVICGIEVLDLSAKITATPLDFDYEWLDENNKTPSAIFAIDATVEDIDGDAGHIYTWSVLSGPAASFADTTLLSTNVTFTAAGDYVLQVEVNDAGVLNSDSIAVTVYENGCEAAKVELPYRVTDARKKGDTNYDCEVNLADFAILASNWMTIVSK
jgi:hypothetical protein